MTNLKQSENSHEASINKKFSLIKRAESFTHAGRGLFIFLKTTHNVWLEIFAFILVIFLGLFFQITKVEWLMIIIVSGIVFIAEAFNTAMEIDIDLTSPTYHPYAKDTKDVAAGAVLLAAILATVVGIMIFAPYIQLWLEM
jgi:diacylglycerol kinase